MQSLTFMSVSAVYLLFLHGFQHCFPVTVLSLKCEYDYTEAPYASCSYISQKSRTYYFSPREYCLEKATAGISYRNLQSWLDQCDTVSKHDCIISAYSSSSSVMAFFFLIFFFFLFLQQFGAASIPLPVISKRKISLVRVRRHSLNDHNGNYIWEIIFFAKFLCVQYN